MSENKKETRGRKPEPEQLVMPDKYTRVFESKDGIKRIISDGAYRNMSSEKTTEFITLMNFLYTTFPEMSSDENIRFLYIDNGINEIIASLNREENFDLFDYYYEKFKCKYWFI